MKIGTRFNVTLIADERFLKNHKDCKTLLSIQRDSLKQAVYGEGMEIYKIHEEKVLDGERWGDGKEQIRQNFELMLTKPLTKNQIYSIINPVRAQPLKFK